ncbi:MAG TPA: response regulator [Flavobacterium sp.]|jgi:CheY-like chemotaxis protein
MNTSTNSPMNILLADDDADDRALFKAALDEMNVDSDLTMVKDGKELMNFLENQGNALPHILFLDLNMPGKSGTSCLNEIRSQSRFRDVSVAIYSTSNSEKDIEETLSGGANVYIHKPDDFEKLKQIIKHVLKINWQYHTSGLDKETFFLSI